VAVVHQETFLMVVRRGKLVSTRKQHLLDECPGVGLILRMMLRFIPVLVALLLAAFQSHLHAAPGQSIHLWPGAPPGDGESVGEEHDTTQADGREVAGRRVIRLGAVSTPTLTLYPATNSNSTAVIVCPGGGYSILAMDLEGTEVCDWLNSIGMTGILLKYRVPRRAGDDAHKLPLQDIQRALSLARQNAPEWKIDPHRLGVLGFSAGGHLCAQASTHFAERAYPRVDAADELSCRPDFTLLIYPAYLLDKQQPGKVAPGLTVTSNHPPCFIAMAADDPLGLGNAFVYAEALSAAKVPVEIHVYERGGHGFGMRPLDRVPATRWPQRALDWLKVRGY
jgi:acetyl esterase/lipase